MCYHIYLLLVFLLTNILLLTLHPYPSNLIKYNSGRKTEEDNKINLQI